jgi:hypothetical protein
MELSMVDWLGDLMIDFFTFLDGLSKCGEIHHYPENPTEP